MKFEIDQNVSWISQSHGFAKLKSGVVVEIIPDGGRPPKDYSDLHKGVGCGIGRKGESYVIRVNSRHYWPRVALLKLSNACAHCQGTGVQS